MGHFRKHRAVCFISLLLKTETGTWHLCYFPKLGKDTPAKVTRSPFCVFAQICARSTDILHGNYPRSRGNLPLQRISSPTIIHENLKKSNTFATFFYTSFQTNFCKIETPYMVMLHKNRSISRFLPHFSLEQTAFWAVYYPRAPLLNVVFCYLLTKMRYCAPFCSAFFDFFGF